MVSELQNKISALEDEFQKENNIDLRNEKNGLIFKIAIFKRKI